LGGKHDKHGGGMPFRFFFFKKLNFLISKGLAKNNNFTLNFEESSKHFVVPRQITTIICDEPNQN
jgi:hypothetical protein